MTDDYKPVRFIRAALDEVVIKGATNQIVLRGVIDPKSLPDLRIDEYQREALPPSALTKLYTALKNGESLPDIELGMRGSNYDVVAGGEYLLKGPVYIIDGQQRRNAALHILNVIPDLDVRIGAMVHFSTSREWERERFRILNLDRAKVSGNVLLRNMRHQSAAILTLYGLSFSDSTFALFHRVCWKQAQGNKELITARSLVSIAANLHNHHSPATRNSLNELAPALDRQAKTVGLNRWRTNIVEFFDFVDRVWGLRSVEYRDLSLQIRRSFLDAVSSLLSEHVNFWHGENDSELYIDADMTKRFQSFPLHDPAIVNMITGAGGSDMLYSVLCQHLNRGRSTGRLRDRQEATPAERRVSSIMPERADEDEEELEYPH